MVWRIPLRHLRVGLGGCLLFATGQLSAGGPGSEDLGALRRLLDDGRYAQAESTARGLLAEVEANAGPESPEAVDVLDALVESLWRQRKSKGPEVRGLAGRALGIRKALDPDDPLKARSMNNLAVVLRDAGEYAEAKRVAEEALAIREEALGPDDPEVAESLGTLGTVLRITGDYAGARPLFERALGIDERAYGGDRPEVARCLNNLGVLLWTTGEYGGARPLLERALAIDERALRPEHPYLSQDLNNLAILLQTVGDYSAARPLLERLLRLDESTFGPDHPFVAQTLNNLGGVLYSTGDYLGARALYERALKIKEKAFGPDHPEVTGPLNNLGLVDREIGEYALARSLYERSLRILEGAFGPEHPLVAGGLTNLAIVLHEIGDLGGAQALYERAFKVKEKTLPADHPNIALTLSSLASVRLDRGDPTGALPPGRRALAIREKSLGPDHPEVATSLYVLANVLRATGADDEARGLYERALEIRERQLGPEHPDVALVLGGLAGLLWDHGEDLAALTHVVWEARVVAQQLRDTVPVLSEKEALRLVSTRQRPEQLLFSGLLAKGANTASWLEASWEWTLSRRGVILEELASRHEAAARGGSPEGRRDWERLAETRRRLAALWVRGPDAGHPERYRPALDEARRAREEAEESLARASARFGGERRLGLVGPKDVARALPAGSALVEVVRVPIRSPKSGKGSEHDIVLILRPDRESRFIDLGLSSRIDRRVLDWREALRGTTPGPASGNGEPAVPLARLEQAGELLREAVWDPIERQIGDVRMLFIVPDATLHHVNLAALPARGGGYVVEKGPSMHLLSTGRDLVRLQEGRTAAGRERGGGLLALGDPDFETDPGARAGMGMTTTVYRGALPHCSAFSAIRWSPLDESRREVRQISGLFKGQGHVVVLTGSEATEGRFKREAPGKRIVHLATHGFFLQEGCTFPGAAEGNPLLLSGLVLAGANHSRNVRPADAEDGVLTAEELAALDLGASDLVVLSGCDTGRGEVEVAEGVFGLRRALEIAGVRTVVMSLWPVPDRQARRWMARFYEKILGGDSIIEAARGASLRILQDLRDGNRPTHPYLWAGFVAAGDWR